IVNLDDDLWTCPECGHRFVTPNIWHSCGNYELEDHFVDREAAVRETFTELERIVQEIGPVTVYAQKTRIVFQVRTRFAAVMTRKKWLNLQLWLRREVSHPLLQRVEMFTYRDHGHIFRLQSPQDIDEQLVAFLRESYALGSM
ncbi:MAG: DUF5655 domain-containing protein, partial [Anaerolineales bacterium]